MYLNVFYLLYFSVNLSFLMLPVDVSVFLHRHVLSGCERVRSFTTLLRRGAVAVRAAMALLVEGSNPAGGCDGN
ncbi:hypothetical protein Y032_0150g2768 [Ancylostoma ceylanicum]|uniref:Uncharacterized protein n=1 Tax=Ancylostoma ceylanicum TaxID=53326 RepID=A0A016T1J9_9BILA|nr:hypothetical protein Y032_0150g2768 [Ancylostoma ceylanicum]